MDKAALHIVLNPFTHDARVLREVTALSAVGIKPTVFCLYEDGLARDETHETHQVRRFHLITRGLPKKFSIN